MGAKYTVRDIRCRALRVLLLVGGCVLGIRPSLAEQLVLNLVPQSSSLIGLGYIEALDVNTTAQDPNGDSLTTTYSGTITVDVDNLSNPTSITFVSASAVAANSGNWLPTVGGGAEGDPGAPAPANYGFFLDAGAIGQLYAASRDTILSLDAPVRTITAGQFDPFGVTIQVVQGIYDSNVLSPVFGNDAGTDDIADELGTNCTDMEGSVNRCGALMGSYSLAGGLVTLNLPLNFILGEGDDVEVTFTGSFMATASLSQPLFGDYNDNGTVDAADYVVWRDNNGTTNVLPNDEIGGMIGPAHYAQWRENFGNAANGGGFGSAAVPEPSCASLVLVSFLGWWAALRRRRRVGLGIGSV